ncbi:hypothetical protein GN956_G2575 [Arapaima gigas]
MPNVYVLPPVSIHHIAASVQLLKNAQIYCETGSSQNTERRAWGCYVVLSGELSIQAFRTDHAPSLRHRQGCCAKHG